MAKQKNKTANTTSVTTGTYVGPGHVGLTNASAVTIGSITSNSGLISSNSHHVSMNNYTSDIEITINKDVEIMGRTYYVDRANIYFLTNVALLNMFGSEYYHHMKKAGMKIPDDIDKDLEYLFKYNDLIDSIINP